jgi:cell division septal protein FtsQ
MSEKKKKNPPSIKRRKKIFSNPFANIRLDLKKISLYVGIFSLTLIIVTTLAFYRTDHYQINELRYLNREPIGEIISARLQENTFLSLNTNELENDIKLSSDLIKNVRVSKSIINGIIVDINEYEPLVILETVDGTRYLISTDSKIIKLSIDDSIMNIVTLKYVGNSIEDTNLFAYTEKAKYIYTKTSGIINGTFNFDNFGNLFILLEGNRVVRFDLNERYFTLDVQFKLLQDAMSGNKSFSEIDIRFSYLLVK